MIEKSLEIIRRNYIYVNIVGLLFSLYIILFPLISDKLTPIFPFLFECPYLKMTRKPCPLCGGTRYFKNSYMAFGNITYLFHPFGMIFIFVMFELFFRAYNIISIRKEKSLKYIKIDLLVHMFEIECVLIYEIVYLIKQNY